MTLCYAGLEILILKEEMLPLGDIKKIVPLIESQNRYLALHTTEPMGLERCFFNDWGNWHW